MTDRVQSSSKAAAPNPSFPATKAQLYGATRPTYRPQPYHRHSSRGWCCTLILILLILLLLLGIAGTVVYLLYRPQRPSFTVTSLNLTTSSSEFDLTLSATNPNKKIVFSYEPASVSILSGDTDIADGTIPSFEQGKKETRVLRAGVSSKMKMQATELKVKLETKVEAKMGGLKTPHVGIRVLCDGITVTPKKKSPAMAYISNAECKVDMRFKVWKWTLG